MMVIFPFEVDFYKKHNVIAHFVGNTLSHQVSPTLSKNDAYKKFNLNPQQKIIGILPGSRHSEIKHIAPTLIQAVKQLKQRYSDAQFVLPLANSIAKEDIERLITAENLEIKIISNELYNLLQLCDAAICVSGTVTLEVALMGVPFIIIYKLSPISFLIGRLLVKVNLIGLCNIIAGQKIVPEFIQHQATPEAISSEIVRLIEDEKLAHGMREQLLQIKESLSGQRDESPAEIILSELS
jgi:lipid-A-disaccharide synthase